MAQAVRHTLRSDPCSSRHVRPHYCLSELPRKMHRPFVLNPIFAHFPTETHWYSSIAFVTPEGTGYLQSKFASTCPTCSFSATKESLGVLKFARDVTLNPRSPEDKKQYGYGVYMAGTLRTILQPTDETIAALLKIKLHITFKPPEGAASKDDWARSIMAKVGYKTEGVQKNLALAFAGGMRRWAFLVALRDRRTDIHMFLFYFSRSKKVLSAYIDDRPFSVELVGAVIRQCSFVDKMTDFGWTEPGAFDQPQDEVVLQHAIARYHA